MFIILKNKKKIRNTTLRCVQKMCGCDMGIQFSGERGGASLIFGLSDLKGLFKPKMFCESMILLYFLSWYFTSGGK